MGLINGWAAGNSKQRQHAKISPSGCSLLRMAHEWMGPAKKKIKLHACIPLFLA
jgi:hypothetical protein